MMIFSVQKIAIFALFGCFVFTVAKEEDNYERNQPITIRFKDLTKEENEFLERINKIHPNRLIEKVKKIISSSFPPTVNSLFSPGAKHESLHLFETLKWQKISTICSTTPKENSCNVMDGLFKKNNWPFSQGFLGDCYFVSGLELFNEHKRLTVIPHPILNQMGYYIIRFWNDGWPLLLIIDDQIPVDPLSNKPVFLMPYFAALFEKAYAALYGNYLSIEKGFPVEAFSLLSGFPSRFRYILGIRDYRNENYCPETEFDQFDFLFSLINHRNGLVTSESYNPEESEKITVEESKKYRIKMKHSYRIKGVFRFSTNKKVYKIVVMHENSDFVQTPTNLEWSRARLVNMDPDLNEFFLQNKFPDTAIIVDYCYFHRFSRRIDWVYNLDPEHWISAIRFQQPNINQNNYFAFEFEVSTDKQKCGITVFQKNIRGSGPKLSKDYDYIGLIIEKLDQNGRYQYFKSSQIENQRRTVWFDGKFDSGKYRITIAFLQQSETSDSMPFFTINLVSKVETPLRQVTVNSKEHFEIFYSFLLVRREIKRQVAIDNSNEFVDLYEFVQEGATFYIIQNQHDFSVQIMGGVKENVDCKIAIRSSFETNDILLGRQWYLANIVTMKPLSTLASECKDKAEITFKVIKTTQKSNRYSPPLWNPVFQTFKM